MAMAMRVRRSGARVLMVVWVAVCWGWGAPLAAMAALPQVGPADADFAGVDRAAIAYLEGKGQPGASVVVAYGERIVYAQGYGYANREQQLPTSPWLEYRLASVSKTFTATAILRLVEQGRVGLDAPAWPYVAAYMGAEPADSRVRNVTVRQLLTHSWGLDRALSGDPNGTWVRDASGNVISTSRELLRRRLLTQPLDFAPGARYAYNNAGYGWLQLIAELVDGRPLDRQLTEMMGAEALSTGRVRIGTTLPSAITPAEPTYYDYAGAPTAAPVPGLYPAPEPARVARPQGAFTLQGYGGGGGLVASAFTVTRFIQRLQGIRQPALLQPATFAQMRTEQTLADGPRYVGLGVVAAPAYGSDYWLSFNGSILGTRTGWLSTPRSAGGPRVTVVALVNGTWAWDWGGETPTGDNIHAELVEPILRAVDAVGYTKVAAKPEITGDHVLAAGSSTEAYHADILFDWAERVLPALFPGHPASGLYAGYRYRWYAPTDTYLATRDGRVWLYQPASGGAILDVGTMTDYLPQATRDMQPVAAPTGGAAR